MMGEASSGPGFNIGIAMAGAVSGGAYSAGVFDFLMEALDEWQKAKDNGDNVPRHNVFISAISGTSAGGITAAMGLASLAGGIRSVEAPSANPASNRPIKRVLPELYDIWVKKVRLFDTRSETTPGAPQPPTPSLLDTSDIKPGCAPDSLLNSDVLTSIARDALGSIRASGKRLPFFTNPVHVFLTHTNLDGVPYPIEFTKDDAYTMLLHEGRAHFAVTNLGERAFPSECNWLENWHDAGVPIDLSKLGSVGRASNDGALKEPFESFTQAALTTSAFPFGFSARRVTIERAKMWSCALPFDPGKKYSDEIGGASRGFLPLSEGERHAHFVCIDGGAMNNEPFEIVRWAIRSKNTDRNTRDSKKADRAVILIAPFPPSASVSKDAATKVRPLGIGVIGKALIPALINQARFKASDLIAASDPDVYSRFLISPKPKLASEPLYAFGGFLDEQFREHDFQLGRRNCQRFLLQHFTLDRENPVFGENPGPAFKAIEDPRNPFDPEQWPIIPLVGSAALEVQAWGRQDDSAELPAVPIMPRRNLADLRDALRRRSDLLFASYISQIFKDYPSLRVASHLSWSRHRGRLLNDMVALVDDQLQRSHQIEPMPKRTLLERLRDLLRSPAGILSVLFILLVVAAIFQFAFY